MGKFSVAAASPSAVAASGGVWSLVTSPSAAVGSGDVSGGSNRVNSVIATWLPSQSQIGRQLAAATADDSIVKEKSKKA